MRQRRRPSRIQWICATAAPWALASGLLVSFTASAGQDLSAGWSTAPLVQTAELGRFPLSGHPEDRQAQAQAPRRVVLASFSPEIPVDMAIAESGDGLSPREGLKLRASGFSVLGRGGKGAPLIAPQPSLSRIGLDGALAGAPLRRLMFDGPAEVAAPGFVPAGEMMDWPQHVFVPLTDGDGATRSTLGGTSSSGSASGGATAKHRIVSIDGATPSTPRAIALSSATPAPADATPVEVAAAPVSIPEGGLMTARPVPGTPKADENRPAYATLIDPQAMSKEQRCLAEAVYFEARSESEEGQAAVAQVVLNRVKSGLYPKTVCGVVYQNRHRYLGCQFSFACEGKSLRITEAAPWNQAVRVAREVTEGKTYLADVGGATHYHADYVRPFWAKKLKKMDTIGRHIFYKLRPGQT